MLIPALSGGLRLSSGNFSRKTCLRRVRIGVMILDFGYVEIQSFSLNFSCRFLITQFLATEALGKIGDSPAAVFLFLCVNFHKCVNNAF